MSECFNILLAEDDAADFDFFTEAFEKISDEYRVIRAKNGLECMTMLKTSVKPNFIFLDLKMPGYNGIDCLRFIKANQHFAAIPVIIFSNSHYIKDIDTCFKNDAHFYIVKPALADHLVVILKQVMDCLKESLEQPGKKDFVVRVTAALEG